MPELGSLRVCFVAGTLGPGGSERQLYYILKALRQAGASPRVLSLTQGEFWEDRFRDLGVPVTFVGESSSRLARAARIIAELRRCPADVVQSQHFYTNLYVVAAARALGIAEVGAIRSDGDLELRVDGKLLGRMSLRAPRLIAANSREAIRNAIATGAPPGKFFYVPNVVDTDEFCPATHQEDGTIRLLAVGRLDRNKRFDRVLDVVARARKTFSLPFRATIVGDGPERPRLKAQAEALGLRPPVVEFRELVANMAPVYREADILVLTSEREGTPNVILEAMACGVPIVAMAVGGVPEIVLHGETGYLVPAHDEERLLETLLSIGKDRDSRERVGARARESVSRTASLHQLSGHLNDLYRVAIA